jgi:hypothetical protein
MVRTCVRTGNTAPFVIGGCGIRHCRMD